MKTYFGLIDDYDQGDIRTEDERANQAAGILRAHEAERVMTSAG